MKVFSQDLWPLGLGVAGEVAPLAPPAVWDALKAKKPESPIVTLGSRASMGASFTLNDWFKDLPPAGRYRLAWRPQTFFQNLETVFPEIAALPDAVAIKAICTDPKVFARDVAGQPLRLQYRNFDREVIFTIFDPINPAAGKKYYASVEFDRGTVWFELFADRQTEGVRQFARLAQTGFYDWLSLFDIQKGSYLRGGSPTENDFGGPEQFVAVQNLQKITHEKGTLSLVSRTSRAGKEVGSIFFICRKSHPEWDEDHIPIGKVISGDDVLERIDSSPGRVGIRKINILTADKLPQEVAGGAASPLTESKEPGRVQPVVKIKTSKGEFSMELFEDDAPKTVANFIELSEKGTYNPDPNKQQDKELTFYYVVSGTLLLTGSPTNDDRGGPGYRIASETDGNKKTHVKGTLTMLLETDPVSKNPVPDSAGSQFMICLQDIPAWNGLYTPFGKVTEGMDVVEKLVQGDKIESVTVVTKRNHPYKAQTLPLGR